MYRDTTQLVSCRLLLETVTVLYRNRNSTPETRKRYLETSVLMSIPVSTLNTTGLTVGQTGTISLHNVGMSAAPATYSSPAHLQFYNESGIGFLITFQQGANSFFLPAGAWNTVPITPGESGVNWIVTYVLQNQPVAQLITVYYSPGENVPSVGTLGNSPLAISGAVTTTGVQTLTNDGNPANTQVIESTVSGGANSNVSIDNSGNMALKQWASSTLTTLLQVIAGGAAGTSNVLVSDAARQCEIVGKLLCDLAVTISSGGLTINGGGLSVVGGTTSLDNGAVTTDGSGNVSSSGHFVTGGGFTVNGGDIVTNTHNIIMNGGFVVDSFTSQNVVDFAGHTDLNLNAPNSGGGHRIIFKIGGANTVAHIDNAGNMVIKGTLTQNGTP